MTVHLHTIPPPPPPFLPHSQKRQDQHRQLMRKWPTLYGEADREAAEALGAEDAGGHRHRVASDGATPAPLSRPRKGNAAASEAMLK
jgi:hypothetical protein